MFEYCMLYAILEYGGVMFDKLQTINSYIVRDNVSVQGYSPKFREALLKEIGNFLGSTSVCVDPKKIRFYVSIPDGKMGSIRGPQTSVRVEIQGAEGDHHIRIAFQVNNLVLAQITIPRNTVINIQDLIDAFDLSGKCAKGVMFGTEKDIIRSSTKK